ncbi:MAG: ATP-binding protein [Candidatus Dormibacteria bacterium]
MVLTNDRGFSDWTQIFADAVVASAIVERLLHNATVIITDGHSYPIRAYRDDTVARAAPTEVELQSAGPAQAGHAS